MKTPFWCKLTVLPLAFLLDHLTKRWVVQTIPLLTTRPLFPGFLQLTHVENRGAAFGMLESAQWLFLAATVVALAVFVWIFATKRIYGEFGAWALMLVVSGALGNFIDRARQGYVVDMLEFEFIRFAIFNVADMFITTGGVMLVVYLLFFHEKLRRRAAPPISPPEDGPSADEA